MADEGLPTRSLSLSESIDLPTRLEQAAIEYLDVNQTRLVVIAGAIYLVDVEEGTIDDAQTLTVRLWEPAQQDAEGDKAPDDEIEAFIGRLVGPE